ncbi:helicase with zinc finger domain 2-like [Monodon monoceros]|uniref:helicase with zinc finger domain 2-like n=1 Tax=Monodon monoceros TaxID=40151 RepID=UPI0010F43BA2|nr:helicase with zinc finger domain 2-like [Monodon monoceros]
MGINPGWGRTAGPLLEVNSAENQLSLRYHPTEPGQHQRRHCQGRKAAEELSLAGLRAQVDLCLGCFRCTQWLDGKDLAPEQAGAQLLQDILLARLKPAARSRVWCEADRLPTIPRLTRPGLPLLQPGLGCRRHHNQHPFARSPEEALVWTFDCEHCGSRLRLKTRVRGSGARGELRAWLRPSTRRWGSLPPALLYMLPAPSATPQPRGLPGLLPQARSLPLSPFPREHQGRRKPQGVEVWPRLPHGQPLAFRKSVGRGWPCGQGAS